MSRPAPWPQTFLWIAFGMAVITAFHAFDMGANERIGWLLGFVMGLLIMREWDR